MRNRPACLKQGDTVALVSVSSPVTATVIARSVEYLQGLGLRVQLGEHILDRHGYLAGTAEARASDLNEMFSRDDVKAVFCAYGGAGANQLLPHIDYRAIARHPKVFVGLSDSSVLALGIHSRTGVTTFHGPTGYNFGESGVTPYTEEHFVRALFRAAPIGELGGSSEWLPVRPGSAVGPIIGANLTLLQSLLGTPWEPDWDGRILFWEDMGIALEDIDRVITQLSQAGVFSRISGMVVGTLVDCGEEAPDGNDQLEEIIARAGGDASIPIVSHVALGHTDDKVTIPLGVRVLVDVRDSGSRIEFIESATVEDI